MFSIVKAWYLSQVVSDIFAFWASAAILTHNKDIGEDWALTLAHVCASGALLICPVCGIQQIDMFV